MANLTTTVVDPLREAVLLSRAEHRANAILPEDRARAIELVKAGRERFEAALSLGAGYESATAILLREAVILLLLAHNAQRGAPSAAREDAWTALNTCTEVFDLGARQGIESALRVDGWLADDRAPVADVEARNTLLIATARALFLEIELRTPESIHISRVVRLAAVALCLAVTIALLFGLRAGPNLARGRRVSASSIDPQSPAISQLVDGDPHGAFGAKTSGDPSPWLMVDLGGSHAIDRIVVFNRGDGREEDCLPLVAEISLDAQDWQVVERRSTRFTQDSPWEMQVGGARARYVRLRVDHLGYLALSEIAVYGK